MKFSHFVINSCHFLQIKLADKQAALEKIQWEAMTSNRQVEKLQEELDSIQGDISSFILLFEGLMKNGSAKYADDYDVKPCFLDYPSDIVSLGPLTFCIFNLFLLLLSFLLHDALYILYS